MPAADSSISLDALRLDPGRATEEIVEGLRNSVLADMRRRGAVVGLSGGVDSSVCVALCARAFEPERVVALLMPEAESASDTLELSRLVADHFGVETVLEDISGLLDAAGCYRRRDDAIRRVLPEYGPGWRAKIVLPSLLDGDRLRVFSLVAESPGGESRQVRLTADAYREVVAATSFKQRTRKMLEYYHADRVTYAVVGTPNRLEYDQGFFVKNGDGAADVKPIAHLYKTQVYQLAEFLDVPEEVRSRPPTTDTYSLPQSQEEFYFSVSYETMDLCLYALNHGLSPASVSDAVGLSIEEVERVYHDIETKRRATAYLQLPPQLVQAVPEIVYH
jgi:NAD+ synthase